MIPTKSLLHYQRYLANITIRIRYCGDEIKFYTSTDFICAFSLRQLQACIHPWNYFPRRFCIIDIDFIYDDRPLPSGFNSSYALTNYSAIEQQIMRSVIFVISSQLYIYEKGF